ncbi:MULTISPECIES: sigma-54-dependent transcriptional regulator [Oceanimonas]|uniref:Sigma-54-dependent Fis family transcriptional regulator n=1 Tax=Oceanimonas doudoroffii TaxID=84158 RepID=A0A233RJ74_9GAMM|nr:MULTISPECIES: sigma-54 dependent transcriptional regulator [Oceanimonas]NHH99950.1 Nitrogen regulation protein NR(I) [Oceanimonas sp. MB9]OXY83442.1 sigma-54-dependent Fis family transcriptional regulator [Oceanimonas doudoroffii]
MTMARIVVIDDEPAFRTLSAQWLRSEGYEVHTGADLDELRALLGRVDADLILLDLSLPPLFDPHHTLAALPEFTDRPVIILTGHGERELALEALRQGAWDLLAKPMDPDLLAVVIRRAITKHQLVRELNSLKTRMGRQHPISTLIGASPAMNTIRALVGRIAPTDVRVLVTGPSGTGKEVISRAIHDLSTRADGPFISVHCGAIPAELLESELFGHTKGAFTGADRNKDGLLKLADGGTLFLDEIGDMPLAMQVKLLRVLQEGSFYPVGGRTLETINVRVISATNASLPDRVASGEFREDLFYRIKGVTIETRPLDERPEDIPLLVSHFLELQAQGCGQPPLHPDSAAFHWFIQRRWPGNVRELKSTLDSVAAIAQGGIITLDDIALLYPDAREQAPARPQPAGDTLDAQVRALEIALITDALTRHDNNRTHAAQALGLSRQGLLKKIERYGL